MASRVSQAELGALGGVVDLLYLIVKEVFWYELLRTPRSLAVGVWRLYLPVGVMKQVSATKNRGVKA